MLSKMFGLLATITTVAILSLSGGARAVGSAAMSQVRIVMASQRSTLASQRGQVDSRILLIIVGVITIVIGLVLEGTILTQAAASGSNANIGSFSGAQALNDLVPLIYNSVVVLIGVGMMAVGGLGFAGKGPASS